MEVYTIAHLPSGEPRKATSIGPAVHLRGVACGSVAGETEEFGDGDDLVATGLELGDEGLHGLDGALIGVVEEEIF